MFQQADKIINNFFEEADKFISKRKTMTTLETMKHYHELIGNRINDAEEANDDDQVEIMEDIEQIVDEFLLELTK
jgi:tRNA G37 N-methylase Trm5